MPKTVVRGDYTLLRARSAPLPECNVNGKRPVRSRSTCDLDTFLKDASDSQIFDMLMGPDVLSIEQSARADLSFEGLDYYDTLLSILHERSFLNTNDVEMILARSFVPLVRPSALLAKAFMYVLNTTITSEVQLWPKNNKHRTAAAPARLTPSLWHRERAWQASLSPIRHPSAPTHRWIFVGDR